jgi:hypothetical protein
MQIANLGCISIRRAIGFTLVRHFCSAKKDRRKGVPRGDR